jgi:hypothetical protein
VEEGLQSDADEFDDGEQRVSKDSSPAIEGGDPMARFELNREDFPRDEIPNLDLTK